MRACVRSAWEGHAVYIAVLSCHSYGASVVTPSRAQTGVPAGRAPAIAACSFPQGGGWWRLFSEGIFFRHFRVRVPPMELDCDFTGHRGRAAGGGLLLLLLLLHGAAGGLGECRSSVARGAFFLAVRTLRSTSPRSHALCDLSAGI